MTRRVPSAVRLPCAAILVAFLAGACSPGATGPAPTSPARSLPAAGPTATSGAPVASLAPTASAVGPASGRILFACQRPKLGLCVVGADGSALANVPGTAGVGDASWSPDGTTLAFVTTAGAIEAMRLDGSMRRTLRGSSREMVQSPAWSPDGRSLLFVTHPACTGDGCMSPWTIRVMAADGSNVRTVTTTSSGDRPSWTADGVAIIFGSASGGLASIHADGTHVTQLTTGEDSFAASSPDGRTFAFERQSEPDASGAVIQQLFVAATDGAHARALLSGTSDDEYPAWSPTGEWVAWTRFAPDANGTIAGELWLGQADGAAPTEVTSDARASLIGGWR